MSHSGEQGKSEASNAAALGTVFDVSTQRVARVYAEALLRAAAQRQQVDEILEELEALVQKVFQGDPQLETFFSSSALGRERRAQVVRSVFEHRSSELFVNALLVLNDHERLDLLRPMVVAYRERHDERAGRMRVQVQSAVPLPEDQREQLRQQLRAKFNKEPLMQEAVDAELLGGVVVRVGDWLFDRSVRTQLETIRNQVLTRSSHEIQSRRDRFCTPDGN